MKKILIGLTLIIGCSTLIVHEAEAVKHNSSKSIKTGSVIDFSEFAANYSCPDKALSDILLERKVIIDFFSNGCPPCRAFAPTFKQAAQEHTGVVFVKINVSDHNSIANRYNVRKIPSIRFFVDGQETGQEHGKLETRELTSAIRRHLR